MTTAKPGAKETVFANIKATTFEVKSPLLGDDIVTKADITMDRAFSLTAKPASVWPWLMQLGKNRAGWYLPRYIELFIPKKKRALRFINPKLQDLSVGKVIDDWGGHNASFEVASLDPPRAIVYKSLRRKTDVSWAITLRPDKAGGSRVHLRLRLSPVKHQWLAKNGGNFIDALTIAGLAAGLRERLADEFAEKL